MLFKKEKKILKIYNHKVKANKNNPYIIFMHKIFLIAVYLEMEKIVDVLIENF